MKIIIALALVVMSSVAYADETASTDDVTVEFIGASGGLKIFPKSDSKSFIMVQQDKLEEVAADGSAVSGGTSINVAGQNSWTALTTTVDANDRTVYSTTFTKESGQTHFELSAHLAREDTTATEYVPCNNCTGGTSGGCQRTASDMACATVDSGTEACTAGYDRCSVTVAVVKDELKFSIVVGGFPFQNTNNKLKYAVIVKDKSGNKGKMDETAGEGQAKSKEISLDGGYIVTPTTAVIRGGDDDEVVDVVVTPSEQGNKRVITFVFDSFTAGKSLYYDPALVNGAVGHHVSLSFVKVLTLVAISLGMIAAN